MENTYVSFVATDERVKIERKEKVYIEQALESSRRTLLIRQFSTDKRKLDFRKIETFVFILSYRLLLQAADRLKFHI